MTDEKWMDGNENPIPGAIPDPEETAILTPPPIIKRCTQCGQELAEDQIFCTYCGQRCDLQVAGEVPDSIAQFNQTVMEQSKAKSKKTKLLVILFSIIGVLVIGIVGGIFYLNSHVEGILIELDSGKPSSGEVAKDYKALTPVGQAIFKSEIEGAFVEMVAENVYADPSDLLVDEAALDRYESYKEVGQILEITDDDDTNVMAHINAVLKLEEYEKYNDVRQCVLNSVSTYTDCLEYIGKAADASSYYINRLYVGYAHTYAKSALSSAEKYNTGDELCTKYINSLSTVEEELSDLYYDDGYYSSSSVSSAMSTITGMYSDIMDAEESVEGILESIPNIK